MTPRSHLRTLCLAAGVMASAPASANASAPALDLGASYVSDAFANARGGLDRGFRLMGLAELSAELDGSALGADGVEGFARAQLVHGQSLSGDLVGDAQVVSNIDAPDGLRLFEAWLSVPVADKGYVKGGLIDLNGEFDVQNVGALFLNSSHGIGPDFSQSGLNGPSIFPTSSTALVAGWNGAGWSARLGLFDAVAGDPDHPRRTVVRFPGARGLLLVAEVDAEIAKDVEFQVGAWRYTSKFEPIAPDPDGTFRKGRGNQGAYAMVEGQVGKIEGQPLAAWVRTGVAETEFNPIGLYVGGGLALGAEDRQVGLAVSHARLGRTAFQSADANRAETIFELTYARKIGNKVTVQPDLQYVINPGWDPALENALVAGVRLRFELF